MLLERRKSLQYNILFIFEEGCQEEKPGVHRSQVTFEAVSKPRPCDPMAGVQFSFGL